MDVKYIVAIIRREKLEAVEEKLQAIGVERVNVSKLKGYGEYHDFFSRSWMVEEVRIEIFTRSDEVETVAGAIMEAAHTGLAGDGVVAVLPVERFFLVRTRAEATPESFWTSVDSTEGAP
jgi:nitrogen regulatory protein P-II 1